MPIDDSRISSGSPSRREFLKTSALAAGASLAGGLDLARGACRRQLCGTGRTGRLWRPRHRRGGAGAEDQGEREARGDGQRLQGRPGGEPAQPREEAQGPG